MKIYLETINNPKMNRETLYKLNQIIALTELRISELLGGSQVTVNYYIGGAPKDNRNFEDVAALIFLAVCKEYGVSPDAAMSEDRHRPYPEVRQLTAKIIRDKYRLDISLSAIGRFMNGVDYSTIIHSCTTAKDLIETNASTRDHYVNVIAALKEVGIV